METQIYVTREQEVAGKTRWIGQHRCSRGACEHWQEKKKLRKYFLIQNTPLSNQTCNTCGGKCISVRTPGMFAWGNLIVKLHKRTLHKNQNITIQDNGIDTNKHACDWLWLLVTPSQKKKTLFHEQRSQQDKPQSVLDRAFGDF